VIVGVGSCGIMGVRPETGRELSLEWEK